MPVRTFRSAAFSAIAPQRVRFIPYIYMAPLVDGPGPIIYTQPEDASNPPSSTVLISLEAAGEGELTYQWQMKPPGDEQVFANITDGVNFSGTDSSQLFIGGITDGTDIYTFRCIVTNLGGSTTSDEVILIGTI